MRYTTIIAAAAFVATSAAQVPACAATAVQDALTAIGGPANIGDLCKNKNGVLDKLTAALEAACDCQDLNSAIALAGTFCPGLNVPKRDCSATSSAAAPVSSAPVSTPASVAPVSSATSAPATSAPVSAPTTSTVVVSKTATLSSVSGVATQSSNGTIVTPPPASTSIVVGSGSVVQAGGVAMIGAFLAALAL